MTHPSRKDLPLPHIEQLPIAALTLYPAFGRQPNQARLKMLRRMWSPAAIGSVAVSRRPNGEIVVIDGNHRVTVALEYDDPATVDCEVYEGLTPSQEAVLYSTLNNALPQSVADMFRADLAAGDPVALAIKFEVEKSGFRVNLDSHSKRTVTCIRALNGVFHSYGRGAITATLKVIYDAFDGEGKAATTPLVGAIAGMLRAYPQINHARLVIAAGNHGYKLLEGLAKTERYKRTPPLAHHLAYITVLHRSYNNVDPTGRLPRWTGKLPIRVLSARELRKRGRGAIFNELIDEREARPD